MKVALVYDRVNKWGGAERLLLALNNIFKDAPIYTSVYNKQKAEWVNGIKIQSSFLQKFPKASHSHEIYASFMPIAFESFSFDNYDVVISVTSESAKGIITHPNTLHLCICLTPTRYLWSGHEVYFKNSLLATIAKPAISYLKTWDKVACHRPDYLIAISRTVKERISEYYKRESDIIYPPVIFDRYDKTNLHNKSTEPYYLIVSRLVSYKKIDVAIKAFNELSLPLKIIGVGNEYKKLKSMSKKNIEFLGQLTDEDLSYYYKNAEALIFPGIEDFGLVMVEAQFFGIPVIAYRGGAAVEIIEEGVTGEFFNKQSYLSLCEVLEKFDKRRYNKKHCEKNASKFSYETFETNFKEYFAKRVKEYFK